MPRRLSKLTRLKKKINNRNAQSQINKTKFFRTPVDKAGVLLYNHLRTDVRKRLYGEITVAGGE